jgi:hypothetical protein
MQIEYLLQTGAQAGTGRLTLPAVESPRNYRRTESPKDNGATARGAATTVQASRWSEERAPATRAARHGPVPPAASKPDTMSSNSLVIVS